MVVLKAKLPFYQIMERVGTFREWTTYADDLSASSSNRFITKEIFRELARRSQSRTGSPVTP